VFGHVLPLSFHDAGEILVDLSWGRRTWLAEICRLSVGHDDAGSSPLWVVPPECEHRERSSSERRTDPRAIERFEAYRFVFEGIQEERLDELATAWWAFFIASQAVAFPGLGLPMQQVAEIAQIASGLLPDEGLERAIRLALDLTREEANSLEFRQVDALLGKVLRAHSSRMANESIIALTISAKAAEAFIVEAIGESTWRKLQNQTRSDLIEVEQLFSRSYAQLGGRADWGSHVALMARAVEAEVRTRLDPLIGTERAAGLCEVSELTLGGCMSAIRQAAKSIRRSGSSSLPDAQRDMIVFMKEVFDRYAFMETDRNRAAHGNRERPVSASDLLRWREAVFHDRFFDMLIPEAG
jgi:hypothetical protein